METIQIKGKEYVTVNQRILSFREHFKEWSLISEIVSMENGVVVMKASVIDEKGIVRATGFAYEKEGSTFINKTSYLENCETSAWGRALANLGIGIITSVASAEEVGNAIKNQNKSEVKKEYITKEYYTQFLDEAVELQKGIGYKEFMSKLGAIGYEAVKDLRTVGPEEVARVLAELKK